MYANVQDGWIGKLQPMAQHKTLNQDNQTLKKMIPRKVVVVRIICYDLN